VRWPIVCCMFLVLMSSGSEPSGKLLVGR
jgi:hypothetical protein